MAAKLKVHRRTIARDLQHWQQTGGLTRWGLKEFFHLYSKAKLTEKPLKLLDRVITLITKLTPADQREETIQEIKLTWNLDKLKYLDKDKEKQEETEKKIIV